LAGRLPLQPGPIRDTTLLPLLTMACHCTGCQRMSASAFSLSVAVPSAGFAVKTGEHAAPEELAGRVWLEALDFPPGKQF
jgi:hypothetical protein